MPRAGRLLLNVVAPAALLLAVIALQWASLSLPRHEPAVRENAAGASESLATASPSHVAAALPPVDASADDELMETLSVPLAMTPRPTSAQVTMLPCVELIDDAVLQRFAARYLEVACTCNATSLNCTSPPAHRPLLEGYVHAVIPVRWRARELSWSFADVRLVHANGSHRAPPEASALAAAVVATGLAVRPRAGGLLLKLTATTAPVPLSLTCDSALAKRDFSRPPRPCCMPLWRAAAATDDSSAPSSRWWTTLSQVAAQCHGLGATPRYIVVGSPHFGGGAQQFHQALQQRGWARTDVAEDADLALASCVRLLDKQVWRMLEAPGRLLSAAPGERAVVLKRALLRAVKTSQLAKACDYTSLMPQSFLVAEKDECARFLQAAAQSDATGATWFLKSALESFGRGIRVANTSQALAAVRDCAGSPPRFFVQRGVERIVKLDGRRTQGRAYVFASSYEPLTLWYFDGYFNVAAAEGDSREALVTNLGSNQKSRRLPCRDAYAALNLSSADTARVRARVKEAFLTVVLALPLVRRAGSFTLLGVDFLLDETLGVKVLEANCNCELFNDAAKFGQERVDISAALVRAMLDAVVVTNLAPEQWRQMLASVPNDFARGEAELLYSEAVKPAWSFLGGAQASCYPSA